MQTLPAAEIDYRMINFSHGFIGPGISGDDLFWFSGVMHTANWLGEQNHPESELFVKFLSIDPRDYSYPLEEIKK